jgi:hypothetical protein
LAAPGVDRGAGPHHGPLSIMTNPSEQSPGEFLGTSTSAAAAFDNQLSTTEL